MGGAQRLPTDKQAGKILLCTLLRVKHTQLGEWSLKDPKLVFLGKMLCLAGEETWPCWGSGRANWRGWISQRIVDFVNNKSIAGFAGHPLG